MSFLQCCLCLIIPSSLHLRVSQKHLLTISSPLILLCEYQFHSFWFHPTSTRTHDLPTLEASMLTIIPPMRFKKRYKTHQYICVFCSGINNQSSKPRNYNIPYFNKYSHLLWNLSDFFLICSGYFPFNSFLTNQSYLPCHMFHLEIFCQFLSFSTQSIY